MNLFMVITYSQTHDNNNQNISDGRYFLQIAILFKKFENIN